MPVFTASQLKQFATRIFVNAGAEKDEADIVAEALVTGNRAGHYLDGVLRISEYGRLMEQKLVTLSAHIRIGHGSEAYAVIDGGWGFGQMVGREAMEVAIQKAGKAGLGTVSVSQCCHLRK